MSSAGRTYRVQRAEMWGGLLGVDVNENIGPHEMVHAARFRKIDAPKTEIAERIKKCRPIKVGEPT